VKKLAPFIFIYSVVLATVERWIVVALAAAVVLGGLAVAAGRTFGLDVGDAPTIQTVVFVLCFYLCMAGGIVATRRAAHIKIDAVTPHLPETFKLRLEGVLLLLSAVVSVLVALAAWRYVNTLIPEGDSLIPGAEGPWWSKRAWRWPIGLCFAWMSLHFLVGGVMRLMGIVPPLPEDAMAKAELELEASEGEAQ